MTLSVVSNVGPLLVLAKLNVLHLLKNLYGQVYIPQAVYNETVVAGLHLGYEDAHNLRLFLNQVNWLPTVVKVPDDVVALPLDRGEQESIAFALSQKALLLMDEERGRAAARQRGLTVRGSLGILIAAYRQSSITADQLRFYFEQIMNRYDIWISSTLCLRLLAEVLDNEKAK